MIQLKFMWQDFRRRNSVFSCRNFRPNILLTIRIVSILITRLTFDDFAILQLLILYNIYFSKQHCLMINSLAKVTLILFAVGIELKVTHGYSDEVNEVDPSFALCQPSKY